MKQKIIERIQKDGPIDTATYMQHCLYDPTHGYYTTRTPFGVNADFITAPELTPLFGEMLGLWVAATWQSIGAPTSFNLIELGPGRGVLFKDMLHALEKAAPACLKACQGHLIEISPHLTSLQKETLKNAPTPVAWHTSLTPCPKQASIVIGNEILDAFPTTQYQKKEDGLYYKRYIDTDGKNLFFGALGTTPYAFESPHSIIEKSAQMLTFLEELTQFLAPLPSACLLIDYGATTPTHGSGDILQAIRRHQKEDIFAAPGKADLTWHIPFSEVCATLGSKYCSTTDMALFLMEIGFPLRAEQAHRAAKTNEQKEHIEQTTKRLLDPNLMGRHFKVLGWSQTQKLLAGFAHCR